VHPSIPPRRQQVPPVAREDQRRGAPPRSSRSGSRSPSRQRQIRSVSVPAAKCTPSAENASARGVCRGPASVTRESSRQDHSVTAPALPTASTSRGESANIGLSRSAEVM
jgi:hypothetical protein